jgi:hypothetical protein
MRKTAYLASGVVFGACLLAVPGQALADGPEEPGILREPNAAAPEEVGPLGPVSVEGGGLIGFTSNPSHGPNPFGVGIGARAGAAYKGLYLGVAVTYYFGASGECGGGAPITQGTSALASGFCSTADGGGEVELEQNTSLYGLDIGYTFKFRSAKWFRLRPILEIGDAEITRTGSVSSQEVNGIVGLNGDNRFYLQPGLTALFVVQAFFAGIDANLLVVPGVTDPEGVTENVSGTGTLTSTTRALAAFTGHLQVGFRF